MPSGLISTEIIKQNCRVLPFLALVPKPFGTPKPKCTRTGSLITLCFPGYPLLFREREVVSNSWAKSISLSVHYLTHPWPEARDFLEHTQPASWQFSTSSVDPSELCDFQNLHQNDREPILVRGKQKICFYPMFVHFAIYELKSFKKIFLNIK